MFQIYILVESFFLTRDPNATYSLDELGSQLNGLQLLLYIVSNCQHIKTSKQHARIPTLSQLDIFSTAGKDVPTSNGKFRNLFMEIEQVGSVPDDLELICAQHFISSEAEKFCSDMTCVVMHLEADYTHCTWQEVLVTAQIDFNMLESKLDTCW